MDFPEIIGDVIEFYQAHPLIAAAGGLFVIYLIFKKPKFFLTVLLIASLLAGTIYLILNAASSGVSQKEKLIKKERAANKEE